MASVLCRSLLRLPSLATILRFAHLCSHQPTVHLGHAGVVLGFTHTDSSFHLDSFLGIPYAQPPIGALRFAAPQPLHDNPHRVINATSFGKACVQPVYEPGGLGDNVSEDCLYLNVIRPSGITPHAKLPVAVWIYGGGFRSGQTSIYPGESFVAQSVSLDEPVIYVSMEYRLNAFGFLSSSEIEKRAHKQGDIALNAGFLDQRLALEWIQTHIEAFGGDKSKVTLFGESAGGISIGAHMLVNGGDHGDLFRGAILESGTPSGPPVPPASVHDKSFATFAQNAGCAPTSAMNTIDCLRQVPTEGIVNALIGSMGGIGSTAVLDLAPLGPVQDGFFYNGRPSEALKAGKIAKIPVITGTNLDEGTMFVSHNIANADQFRDATKALYTYNTPKTLEKTIDKLLSYYPDDPTKGSPYPNPSTPPSTADSPSSAFSRKNRHKHSRTNQVPLILDESHDRLFPPFESNQFKRLASVFGDMVFEAGRRALLSALVPLPPSTTKAVFLDDGEDWQLVHRMGKESVPAWTYHFREPISTAPKHYGVYHSAEIPFAFGVHNGVGGAKAEVSRVMSSAWVHFVNYLNPNGPGVPTWNEYTPGPNALNILQIRSGNYTMVRDDFRAEAIEWLAHDEEWNRVSER